MTATMIEDDVGVVLDQLEAAVARFQNVDLDGLDPAEELLAIRRLEGVRRRLDHATDRAAGHLDRSGAFSLDGHRNAKAALKAIGRLTGSEAHGRVQTSRALRNLPSVEAAYARGDIPTEHVRAIARTVSNPRVAEHVPGADASFADAAMLQALLRSPGGLRCLWPDCDGTGHCLQADHRDPAARGGPTNMANSDVYCGFHNRIKERGFKPVRGDNGEWTTHRPNDGGPITPPV